MAIPSRSYPFSPNQGSQTGLGGGAMPFQEGAWHAMQACNRELRHLDCCYLTDTPLPCVQLLLADKWQVDDTKPQAPWDIASSNSNDETTVQLKIHQTPQQCTVVSALLQPAPPTKAYRHANRQAEQCIVPDHNWSIDIASPPITGAKVTRHITYAKGMLIHILHYSLHLLCQPVALNELG